MEDRFEAKAKEWDNPVKIAMTQSFVDAIKEKNIVKKESSLIDVGCGTGLVGLEFADCVKRLTMVDTSQAMLDVLGVKVMKHSIDNITIIHGDIAQVSAKADAIVSFMALHHIEDTEQFIDEANIRLSENGKVVIGDLYAEDGSFHTGESVPHNGFDTQLLAEEFRNKGFREISVEPLTSVERRGKTYEIFILTALK